MTKKNTKSLVYKIKLSQSDQALLERYCALNDIAHKSAIKKILKEYLSENVKQIEPPMENQLGLFDSFQMNIFD
ncbi:MAG: hypothetical protein ACK5MH_05205 [Bacteroidales bacterium]|jgi:hypothetical protein|nr:hypothetical protein [Bacteroidales bacterium]MDD4544782.1 hypothetical protein [Bacteroidales bacterium]MDY0054651.1 hypothetical protein [Bacteroidales bacterium]